MGADANIIWSYLFSFFAITPYLYFFSRWSLVLPATAIDETFDMSLSWSLSKGNGIRLMFLLGLIPVITNQLLELTLNYDSILFKIFLVIIGVVISVFEIAILSLSYRLLSENVSLDEQSKDKMNGTSSE